MKATVILNRRAQFRIRFASLAVILIAALLRAIGCVPPATDSTASTTDDELGMRAASPECASARAICRAQAQPVIDQIRAACAAAATACASGHGAPVDAAMPPAGAGASCADARSACAAAIAQARPALQQIGQDCEAQIAMACVGRHPTADGGSSRSGGAGAGSDGGGASGTGVADGGASGCLGAVQTCHAQLGDIRKMPPAECATSQMICAAGGFLKNADLCQMAAAACQSALQSTVQSTLQACGDAIAAACRHHGG